MSSVAFDPEHYVTLAEELSSRVGDEAALRAAVSRAYYGCFMMAVMVTKTAKCRDFHRVVRQDLERMNERQLASWLNSMQHLRDVADYQPVPSNSGDRDWERNCRQTLAWGRKALPMLKRLLGI
jgi:hypothetical protein